MESLKVLFNFNEDEEDENNFSAYTFVSTVMLLVINMFANDLKIPVEYLNKISFSRNVDIYINFYDEDGVYNVSAVETIWPHYQNRYCLIYTNTRVMTPDDILSPTSGFMSINTSAWMLTWIFFFIVLYYRVGKSIYDAFGQSFSYTMQSQLTLSIPVFETTLAEKFFMAFRFCQAFFLSAIFLTFFSTLIISPQIKLVTDEEIRTIKGHSLGPITDFGIGEQCLNELRQGIYLRRGCFLTCDVANKTVQKNSGVVFLKEEINFQQVFKVSKESKHFNTIKQLVTRYFEAGMLDRIFNDIHRTSYKFLEENRFGNYIGLSNMYDATFTQIFTGYGLSFIVFICEILYSRYMPKQCMRKKIRRQKKRVRFLP